MRRITQLCETGVIACRAARREKFSHRIEKVFPMLRCSTLLLAFVVLFAPTSAHATDLKSVDPEGDPPPADPANPADPSMPATPAEAKPPVVRDAQAPEASQGLTFRNGFSLSVGQETGSGPSAGLSGQLYGVDWRIGAQVNSALGLYVHSHLSLGTAKIGATSGYTGNLATAVVGEYTLPIRLFVGGGFGYGVLNNPSGPLAELRAGWYPFKKSSDGKARRLNLAVDARFYFAGPAIGTVTHLALSLGYDRF